MIVITLNCDAAFIVNVFGGKNNVVMLISRLIIEEFEYNVICDSTLFYFSTIYFTNYSLWAKRLLYTFLGFIFAVSYVAISNVRILTGLCFVGTPPPLSGGIRLGYFHAYRMRPVSTSICEGTKVVPYGIVNFIFWNNEHLFMWLYPVLAFYILQCDGNAISNP